MRPPRCPYGAATLETGPGLHVCTLIHCKSWQCPKCKELNAKRLRQRLAQIQPNRFLTLTCNPSQFSTPSQAFRHLSISVNRLFKRLRRLYPRTSFAYFGIWELSQSGWPHCHLLLDSPYLPQALVSSLWNELTGAPIIDIRVIRGQKAARNYVLKYVTKDLYAPPNMHRYRSSRGFLPPAPKPILEPYSPEIRWSRYGGPPSAFFANLELEGWSLDILSPTLAVGRPPEEPRAPP